MADLIEIDNKKMETMNEIAKGNLLVSAIKAELIKLEKEKNNFFETREKEVIDRIKEIINSSKAFLEEANTNYTLVHEFCETLNAFYKLLTGAQETLLRTVTDFSLLYEEMNAEIDEKVAKMQEIQRRNKIDAEANERDKEYIRNQRKIIEKANAHLDSRGAQIREALQLLKKKKAESGKK